MTWTVVGGLVLLGALAFVTAWGLESRVVEESLAEQWGYLETHLRSLVNRVAEEEIRTGEGGMEQFSGRMVASAEGNPAILDLVVLTPTRDVAARFTRGAGKLPCAKVVALHEEVESEHAAGRFAEGRVGCLSFPVIANGAHYGAVVVHTLRDPLSESERAGGLVRRTALRLAPIFLGFYALLAVLLIGASRAARRWQLRAASAERVEALGAIADGINHEIRNPLNAVSLSLQFLERRHKDSETREVVHSARKNATRIGETLDEFARFTRLSRLKVSPVSVGERLRSAVSEHEGRVLVEGDARAEVDPDKLDDAFRAIAQFLVQHGCPEGKPRLKISQVHGEWRFLAECHVPAIDEAAVSRLFDPYVRARPRDVGRGLALARAVFQAHGGDLVATRKGDSLELRGKAPTVPPGEN
ncbi:MAG: histidine kinase dimerization/phospho-acceptor domain-containing protein [Planctomycetota bacterium]